MKAKITNTIQKALNKVYLIAKSSLHKEIKKATWIPQLPQHLCDWLHNLMKTAV